MSAHNENKIKTVVQLSDEELVKAARADDAHAMETLLLRYSGMVRS